MITRCESDITVTTMKANIIAGVLTMPISGDGRCGVCNT